MYSQSSRRLNHRRSKDSLLAKINPSTRRRSGSVRDETETHPSVYSAPTPSFSGPPRAYAYPSTPYVGYDRSRVHFTLPTSPAPFSSEPIDATARERPYYGLSQPAVHTPAMTPSPQIPKNIPGPEEYVQFYWKTQDLLSELERLKYALRTVGTCGSGIQAIDSTYRSFERLQWMFGFNTYSLFPRPQDPRFSAFKTENDVYLSEFSRTFESISEALRLMEKAFEDYQVVYYENNTIYLLKCLQKRFKSEAMRSTLGKGGSYSSPSTIELKKRVQALLTAFIFKAIDALRKDLVKYREKGVPVISSAQEVRSTRYLNLTTIATFLSAVTAIFLPISAEQPDGALNVAVNTFLFASLTFSIASAINSLLALSWLKAIVRDPHSYMPFGVTACLNSGPMISLVVAAALFVVGLCLFVFSSSQHIITSITTVAFAGVYTICLLSLAVWLIYEKWQFRIVAGSGKTLTGTSPSMTILDWIVLWPQRIGEMLGSEDPSQLERGRFPGDSPFYLPITFQAEELYANNFLYGARPTPTPNLGRLDESQFDSRHKPTGVDSYPAHSKVSDNDVAPGGESLSSHNNPEPYGRPGYAPTEYPDGTDRLEDEPDSVGFEAGPVIVPIPPVDSQTYEAALFLPRDEITGEYEEVDTASDSRASNESRTSLPGLSYPPYGPGISVPSPMPVHLSENVMIIPTNPPTYVVPPGSYVAYGTQPVVGPSARAGDFTVYDPTPFTQSGSFIPPQIPFIPPRPMPTTAPVIPPMSGFYPTMLPNGFMPASYIPNSPEVPPAPSSNQTGGRRPSRQVHSEGRDDVRSESARENSVLSSARWYPYPNVPPRPSPSYSEWRGPLRRGSSQVRFTQPEVIQPRGHRSRADQSNISRAEGSTSIISEPFTAEPEQMDAAPDVHNIEAVSRLQRSRVPSSNLDSLQQRHRQTAQMSRPHDEHPSLSISGSRRSTVETDRALDGARDLERNVGRSSAIIDSDVDDHPPNLSERLSTVDEVTRSSLTDNLENLNSSGDSLATAPETMDPEEAERKASG
ncbi:hypothetical protein ACEPAH_7493 [Sanghuangporus vaninii]